MDYIDLGPTPSDADCAQVGSENYERRARVECRAFIEQIKRHYTLPEGVKLKVQGSPHDFGTCYNVVLCYDPRQESHLDFAFVVEEDAGGHLRSWDEQAGVYLDANL